MTYDKFNCISQSIVPDEQAGRYFGDGEARSIQKARPIVFVTLRDV